MIEATVDASAGRTRDALADLTTYPEWLPLVSAVAANDDESWFVTLKARLGPLARSKRLRMVRDDTGDQIRFVRAETDGRDHAAWNLSADVEPLSDEQCRATVRLHYGGTLWSTPLESALTAAEHKATKRLSEYLRG